MKQKIIPQKYIQLIAKENLLLLKDLLEPERIKFKNTMTSISKIVFSEKLDSIVYKHNKIYQKTIEMKLVDVKSTTYIDFHEETNAEGPKVMLHHVRK